MDTNYNIPTPEEKKVTKVIWGYNRELDEKLQAENKKRQMAVEEILVFFNDNTAYVENLRDISDSEKYQKMKDYTRQLANLNFGADRQECSFTDSVKYQRAYQKANKLIEKADTSKKETVPTWKKIAVAAGITTLGGVLGACALSDSEKGNENSSAIEYQEENNMEENNTNTLAEKPDITGQNWAFYTEKAPQSNQKEFFQNIMQSLQKINNSENWMHQTLTEEQMKESGFTNPECIFGLTPEEMQSLALRFTTYTPEQIAELQGGENLDVTAIMSDSQSYSNGAIRKIIYYYMNSDSDHCHLGLENLFEFSEKDKADVIRFENMLADFKKLEPFTEEATAKMKEIKDAFLEYANQPDLEVSNAKSYLLRTILPACSFLSQAYQYQDTITLNLVEKETGNIINQDVETAMFDEITMRSLVLGWEGCSAIDENGNRQVYEDAFNSEAFLGSVKIDANKYAVHVTDVSHSIADKSVSGQTSKLEQANEYISNLIQEHNTSYGSYQASLDAYKALLKNNPDIDTSILNTLKPNIETDYSKITNVTYEPEKIMDLMSSYLKENNKCPQNIEYFASVNSNITQQIIDYKDTHGITRGKPGDIIEGEKQEHVAMTKAEISSADVVLDHSGNETTPEKAMEEARKIADEQAGIKNSEQEEEKVAQKKQADAQNVYNATYNHVYGQDILPASGGYDSSWASSSEPEIVSAYNAAVADATSRKEQEAANAEFNRQQQEQKNKVDEEFQNADMIPDGEQTPAPEQSKVVPEQPVTSSQQSVQSENQQPVQPESQPSVQPEAKPEAQPSTQPETSNDERDKNGNGIWDEFEGADMIPEGENVPNSTPSAPESVTNDGFSSEAPEGFAPVVDEEKSSEQAYTISEEELEEYINSLTEDEWNSLGGTIEVEDQGFTR